MEGVYYRYLSSIASEEMAHRMEYDCWGIGLELNRMKNSLTFESTPFFLEKGAFQFRFVNVPVETGNQEFYQFVQKTLLEGYYILGWMKETNRFIREQDAYLIYGRNIRLDGVQLLVPVCGKISPVYISKDDFMKLFLNDKYHCSDGSARLVLVKENTRWNEKESKQRIFTMIDRYLKSDSIWGHKKDGGIYGRQAKKKAWKNQALGRTFQKQNGSIYRMLTHLSDTRLANCYRMIDWTKGDAMKAEKEILTRCCEILY